MRPDYGLTRKLHALVRPELRHPVGKQQQDEAAVEQVDPKQVRHERQFRVELEDTADGQRGGDRVARAGVEPRARDPVVVVVQHRNGVPLAVQQHMQHVQDVRAIRRHQLQSRAVPGPFARRAHLRGSGGTGTGTGTGTCTSRRARRVCRRRRRRCQGRVARDEVLDRDRAVRVGERRCHRILNVAGAVDLLAQLVDAGFAGREAVADDGDRMSVVDDPEAWVKSPVVHVDNIAQDHHEREEVLEEAGAGYDGRRAEDSWWEVSRRNIVEVFPDGLGEGGCFRISTLYANYLVLWTCTCRIFHNMNRVYRGPG